MNICNKEIVKLENLMKESNSNYEICLPFLNTSTVDTEGTRQMIYRS